MQLFVRTRQKFVKKRSLHGVNEHFERIFNAAMAERCVFGQASRIQVWLYLFLSWSGD